MPDSAAPPTRRPGRRRPSRDQVGPAAGAPRARRCSPSSARVIALVALVWLAWWLLIGQNHVTTDNAYVNADVAQITPLVSGPVIAAPVSRNPARAPGPDVLVVIDPTDFQLAARPGPGPARPGRAQGAGLFRQRRTPWPARSPRATPISPSARGPDRQRRGRSRRAPRRNCAAARRLAASGAVSGDELTAAQNQLRPPPRRPWPARAGRRRRGGGQSRRRDRTSGGQHRPDRRGGRSTTIRRSPPARAKVDQAKLDLRPHRAASRRSTAWSPRSRSRSASRSQVGAAADDRGADRAASM